ncbi:hypothetical protein AO381_0849 [Moraxella catarrhalis]|nr:hypothetical protein AO381_0849 [Moraxella catarrhalis]
MPPHIPKQCGEPSRPILKAAKISANVIAVPYEYALFFGVLVDRLK